GSAEFVSELHIVLARFPGVVIDEMPVRVDAVTRDGTSGADLGEASDADRGKSAVVGADSGIETDRVRVKVLILREESFCEAIPSQTSFIDLAGIHNFHVRQRDQLDARRSGGIESGQQAAGKLRKREALAAVAEVIAAGEHVVGVEVLIDLSDEAVDAIEKACRG